MILLSIVCAAMAVAALPASGDGAGAVLVHSKAPQHAGQPVLHPFVSFSIEFSWFPEFAGNKSHPNRFSNQLLENLGHLQGERPIIRVGGNTQDYAIYDPTLETATKMTIIPDIAEDYPRYLTIGPSYFESYSTFPDTKYIHGFNLGQNGSVGMESLLASAPVACKALHGKLEYWELGNEPDQFTTTDRGTRRPADWNEQDYVKEWLEKTTAIRKKMEESCPRHVSGRKYVAPSLAAVSGGALNPVAIWRSGLNEHENIALNTGHNYMGGADSPGVTLQKTLMNHTAVINSVAQHLNATRIFNSEHLTPGIPYILNEMNSLYNQGKPGLSNSFGSALWGVDFNLYCASQNIRRAHMHQGLNYRYASWQPIETEKTTVGTKAPYYGNAMVAAMLHGGDDVRVLNLPLEQDTEAAYAAYVDRKLSRIAVVNMKEFNYSTEDSEAKRPSRTYEFRIPDHSGEVQVQRLLANGSNALSGITWDGWSYNYELDGGVPVRLSNVTLGETVSVSGQGIVQIEVPDSSGAILNL